MRGKGKGSAVVAILECEDIGAAGDDFCSGQGHGVGFCAGVGEADYFTAGGGEAFCDLGGCVNFGGGIV